MKHYRRSSPLKLLVPSAIVLLALLGCGGGGGGGGGSGGPDPVVNNPPPPPPPPVGVAIDAFYSKGPVSDARATLVDNNRNTVAGPFTTSNGVAQFSNVDYIGSVYARFEGGIYTDEATGVPVRLSADFVTRSGVIDVTGSSDLEVSASPLTELGFRRADLSAGGAADLSGINAFIDEIATEFGLPGIDLTSIRPTSLEDISGFDDVDRYGTVLAAITQQQQNTSGGQDPSQALLSGFLASAVDEIDLPAYRQALSDLTTNGNTSPFINSSLVAAILGQLPDIEDPGGNGGNGGGNEQELLTNGDFELGTANWAGSVGLPNVINDGGNQVHFVSVTVAGEAFDVNLSQALPLEAGGTYTLTFRARSDRNRTMIAGIGLNFSPFTAVADTVQLSSQWQNYTLSLTATGIGGTNNRVLFDMGAEIGEVFIDDVSLVLDSSGGGTGGNPLACPGTSVPAATPTNGGFSWTLGSAIDVSQPAYETLFEATGSTHPLVPAASWGSISAPYPTNEWWQNATPRTN